MELTRVPPLLPPSASGMPDMSRGMLTTAASPVVGSMVATMSTSRRSPPESGRQSEPTSSTVRRPSLPSWTGRPAARRGRGALPLVGAASPWPAGAWHRGRCAGHARPVPGPGDMAATGDDAPEERASPADEWQSRREPPGMRPIRPNGTPSRLHHHQAAVDGEHLARDERGLVGGEEGDRVRDLLRCCRSDPAACAP